MKNTVYEEDYRGYHIVIVPDNDFGYESPRDWDGNLGTMACWHRSDNYGDEQPKSDPKEYMQSTLVDNYLEEIEHSSECKQWLKSQSELTDWADSEDVYDFIEDLNMQQTTELFEKYYAALPIYMYEHDSVGLSTSDHRYPFNCPWDAGQLGFIYVDKKKAMKEYKDDLDKIYSVLQLEVETYDDYLNGNIYGYEIYHWDMMDDYDHAECVDSCYGFYPGHGDKNDYDYCLKEAKDIVDYLVKQDLKERWEKSNSFEIMGD